MRLRDYLSQYLLDHSLSTGTIKGYETAINHFAKFAGDKPVAELTLDDVVTWGEHLSVSVTSKSRSSKVRAVMAVLRYAQQIEPPPDESPLLPDEPDEPPRPTWQADPATMTLPDCLTQYLLEHALAEHSAEQLRIVVRQFGKRVGDKLVKDIGSDDVNRWLIGLERRNAPKTVKGKRGNLKTILNAGREAIGLPPLARIRKVRVPRVNPAAFSPQDVARLIVSAESLRRFCPITGIRHRDFWTAFLMVGWDTAVRLGDLLNLRFADVRPDTLLVTVTQHKTGKVHTSRLRPETWQAVTAIARQGDVPRSLLFPWRTARYQFYVAFRELCGLAGLKGTSKYLRRGRATQEARNGGPSAAAKVLGHEDQTGGLALAHYIDQSQLDCDVPLPPPLPIPRAVLERLPGPSTAQAFVEDDDEPGEDDTALEECSLRSQTL